MIVQEFRRIASSRLKEAKTLLRHGHYEGACYLAGYALELALKARICKLLKFEAYPPNINRPETFKTHKIKDLLVLAGLNKKFEKELNSNVKFKANWSIYDKIKWSEENRYIPIGTINKTDAKEFIKSLDEARTGLYKWIIGQ